MTDSDGSEGSGGNKGSKGSESPSLDIFPGMGKTDDLAEGLRSLKANFNLYMEFVELTARLVWIKYEALVKQGFSPIQALELCKKLF